MHKVHQLLIAEVLRSIWQVVCRGHVSRTNVGNVTVVDLQSVFSILKDGGVLEVQHLHLELLSEGLVHRLTACLVLSMPVRRVMLFVNV